MHLPRSAPNEAIAQKNEVKIFDFIFMLEIGSCKPLARQRLQE